MNGYSWNSIVSNVGFPTGVSNREFPTENFATGASATEPFKDVDD
jgi:hypothetical protein